jgi:hypothetical protein
MISVKKSINKESDKSTSQIIRDHLSTNDDDYAWHLLGILHLRGSKRELDAAILLSRSHNPDMRELSADILGQLGGGSHPFLEDSIDILINLSNDKDLNVVNSAVHALGHLEDSRAIPSLIPLVDSSCPKIRSGVAFSLGLVSGNDDSNATHALIKLSKDCNPEVRDWATFALGTLRTIDTHEIREALWDRIENETEWEAYCEAILGLALRKDSKIFDVILSEFKKENPPNLFNAVVSCREYSLLPLLKKLLKKAELEKNKNGEIKEEWLKHLKNCISSLSQLEYYGSPPI